MGDESRAKRWSPRSKGETPEKQILVPIVVATSKNIDKILPTIKETVFANEMTVIVTAVRGPAQSAPASRPDDVEPMTRPRPTRRFWRRARSRRASRRRARSSAPISSLRPGEIHGAARRQRRRQVDALQRHLRPRPSRRRRDPLSRPAARRPQPARGARRRHRHGDAGDQPRARPLGAREHFPARTRPAGPAVARRRCAGAASEMLAELGQEHALPLDAEARDLSAAQRQLVEIAKALGAQRQADHLRRADGVPEPERSRAPVRRDRAARKPRNARSSSSRIGWRRCSRSPTRSPSCARGARSRPRGRPRA